MFKKKSTSSTCAVSKLVDVSVLDVKNLTPINTQFVPLLLQSLLETEGLEEHCRASQSPLSNYRRKGLPTRPTLTPRHSERALLSDSTSSSERNSVGRISGIVRWFRGSKDRESIDLESGPMGGSTEIQTSFMRKGSLTFQARTRATDGIGKSIQRARKRVERRLGRFGIGKGKKKMGGTEDVSGSCKKLKKKLCSTSKHLIFVIRFQSSTITRYGRRTTRIRSRSSERKTSYTDRSRSRRHGKILVFAGNLCPWLYS